MERMYLFCDVSVNQKIGIGFGSYLIFNQCEIENFQHNRLIEKVQNKKFQSTSSTTLEIQILLHALGTIYSNNKNVELTIFTDSQNIVSLQNRRKRLVDNNFISKSKNIEIKNADLYRQFYKFQDEFNFTVIKLIGHLKKEEKDQYHQIFTIVDRESRRVLRNFVNQKH